MRHTQRETARNRDMREREERQTDTDTEIERESRYMFVCSLIAGQWTCRCLALSAV